MKVKEFLKGLENYLISFQFKNECLTGYDIDILEDSNEVALIPFEQKQTDKIKNLCKYLKDFKNFDIAIDILDNEQFLVYNGFEIRIKHKVVIFSDN